MKLQVLWRHNGNICETSEYDVACGMLLLHALQQNGYMLHAVCGGNAFCGKCLVEVKDKGMVYACKTPVTEDMVVYLEQEAPYQILAAPVSEISPACPLDRVGIVIDIGTTTLVFALVAVRGRRVVGNHAMLNGQIALGTDVISRIQAANQGKGELLRKRIQNDLQEGIQTLLKNHHLTLECVEQVVLAGNTLMCHFLLGYPCEGLGKSPFQPYCTKMQKGELSRLLDWEAGEAVAYTILPSIAAFVGADVVAGMYHCGFHHVKAPGMYMDIGTNGELALCLENRIYVTSVAAGPAFEGGNISCGTGSVQGAVSDVSVYKISQLYQTSMDNGEGLGKRYFIGPYVIELQTILDAEPIGICGTGIVSLIAELRKNHIVDRQGMLQENYRERGFPIAQTKNNRTICVTQKDIREFQMAKAALRAGIDCLLSACKLSLADVSCVFLAGGFGHYMNMEKAMDIGMLPAEWSGKIVSLGNASLQGTMDCMVKEGGLSECENIVKSCKEMILAKEPEFSTQYMKYMDLCR